MFIPMLETSHGKAVLPGREGSGSIGPLPRGLGWGMMGGVLVLLLATGSSAQSLDSGTNACRQNPALCLKMAGEEPGVAGSVHAVAELGASVGSVGMLLDSQVKILVERALVECADQARSQVLIAELQGRRPSEQECSQLVPGTNLTLAMLLGQKMHQEAARCAGEKLTQLIPRKFSLEPRYRYDPVTDRTAFISEEEAQLLLRQGRGSELKGTLRPDVVIHSGDPIRAQAVYDFKFGCPGEHPRRWTESPENSTRTLRAQNRLYEDALHTQAWRVIPRFGIMR